MELGSWQESLKPLFTSMGMEETMSKIDPATGNVLLAFLVNECIEPIRFPLVLASVAPVAKACRALRSGGAAAGATGAGAAAAGS
mmetsp:Transcript_37197/g.86298  ORF Transcript_37197/g.86298 Transcript_37197/m.86298 type:complete len:85 (+) Transcript_37197:6-260(+)